MRIRTARIVARTVGAMGLAFAAFGLWYNAMTWQAFVSGAFEDTTAQASAPYFDTAFIVMSGISIACYVALAFCAVQFLCLSLKWVWLFVGVAIVELLLIPVIGRLWQHPDYGMSIGAASGVSTGGVVPQLAVLFPIWAPIVIWLARRALRHREP